MRTINWYWLDGSAYCPGCVECDTPAVDAADATRGPNDEARCACCGATAGDESDADRTQRLYREAKSRVHGDDRLAPFAETILADFPEGDEHWQWVIDADADEILGWAKAATR